MRLQIKNKRPNFKIPLIFQISLNIALVLLGITLCVLLGKEILYFINISIFNRGIHNDYILLERILIFFLYFEFIAMIVKYFLEDYHFPLRYFLYIGITALIRLVIVEHDNSFDTFLHACAILVLIISYSIMNTAKARRQNS
ncbi:phosphate-starvation-inducible protein PsiE [Bacillus wiedmannii]|uniref:phosphate-starvation-inducible protein PsiE n=1 Tax=Bacillus TaxID=1386 RepID=UPI001911BBCE|nr:MULTISPECIES: phosphate-starvation-inducible protein PsiE [Bacillus]MBK5492761.1 phosphate-starvation-inducible protein PsiE [Bacillus sp. TH13]MCX3317588.1 phosphate-starvation-inducible protein PsiE [Bacillus wiedmannii]